MNKCCLCGGDEKDKGSLMQIGEGKVICQMCMDTVMASYYLFIASKPKENPCEFGM